MQLEMIVNGLKLWFKVNDNANILLTCDYRFIFVSVAPNITVGPGDETIVEPNSVTFTCIAEGFPMPAISWFYQNDKTEEIQANSADFVLTSNDSGERQITSTLMVVRVRPSLAGVFICNASNVVDSDIASSSLTVHSEFRTNIVHVKMLYVK